MPAAKKFLVCPLDWGLGHATRLVPVIEALLERGAEVIIGADNRPYDFLSRRFPRTELVRITGYVPHYPDKGSMALTLLKEFPAMKKAAVRAQRYLEDIVSRRGIDVVISDNRYELYAKGAYTIFISHQLNIRTPGITRIFKPLVQKVMNGYIRKFDELWIPDLKGPGNLSGALSSPGHYPLGRVYHVGLLSRFSKELKIREAKPFDLLVILSGPEPQRSILEKMLATQVRESGLDAVFVQGKPEETEPWKEGNIRYFPHVDDETFAGLLTSCRIVLSRPGYSTLMDLAVFGKRAILIPTPGQTEQEYLAEQVTKSKYHYSARQKKFDLALALEKVSTCEGLTAEPSNEILQQRLDELMS